MKSSKGERGRTIVAMSGGKGSAWCAKWAIDNCKDVVLYFNDTKWDDPDLYRFLEDLQQHFGIKIFNDSDGRTPEELFFDVKYLGNSRVALCSIELKAKRLQRFFEKNDTLIFGIGIDELHRAVRIAGIYNEISLKKWGKPCNVVFPMIKEETTKETIDNWLTSTGIKQPRLYDMGFNHNNCGGGCVRAGKKQWKHLLETLPDVYMKREEMEERFRKELGKDVTIIKGITLKEFRKKTQNNLKMDLDFDCEIQNECIGICGSIN